MSDGARLIGPALTEIGGGRVPALSPGLFDDHVDGSAKSAQPEAMIAEGDARIHEHDDDSSGPSM